jgi:hypothetical protein
MEISTMETIWTASTKAQMGNIQYAQSEERSTTNLPTYFYADRKSLKFLATN